MPLQYLGPGSPGGYQGYHAPNQNSATGLNNVINSLRQNQAARNPGMNRPHPPRRQAYSPPSLPAAPITSAAPVTPQTYHPIATPVQRPVPRPVVATTGGAPAVAPAATPAATPITPIPTAPTANPIQAPVAGVPQAPPVVPATGPYGPVAGIPYVRQYG